MLSHLVIRNFAIIEHLEVPLEPGLTVVTGETGAGKSILVDALNLLLGGRASTDVIRTDADAAVVEGIFALNDDEELSGRLSELGIEATPGQLVIRRVVSRSGRNKVFINGCLTALSTLSELTRGLVDISGQHEHHGLMSPERHVDILDAYAGLGPLAAEVAAAFDEVRQHRSALAALQKGIGERSQRIDYLRFQLEEIERVEPRSGESEQLRAELGVLKHAEKIASAASNSVRRLYGDHDSAVARLAEAAGELGNVGAHAAVLGEYAERLKEVRVVVEDIAHDLRRYVDDLDADPRRLDALQSRLENLRRLERKFGGDIEGVIAAAAQMAGELDDLENADERSEEVERALAEAEQRAFAVARTLSQERREAARAFAHAVERELEDLNMAGTRFLVDFVPQALPDTVSEAELTARGIDTVEFLISPNVGEDPKPLSRIASGGEMSRVMLAIKTIHSDRDAVATYIFDEVDAGIGGETADMVAMKLRATSDGHQVLCITHLPQIASRGHHHYRVEKRAVADRTESTVRALGAEERVDEIARMLGGTRITNKTREAARELLRV